MKFKLKCDNHEVDVDSKDIYEQKVKTWHGTEWDKEEDRGYSISIWKVIRCPICNDINKIEFIRTTDTKLKHDNYKLEGCIK